MSEHEGHLGTAVSLDPTFADTVRAWVADDPDPVTAREVADLLEAASQPIDEIESTVEHGGEINPRQDARLREARRARAELADRFRGTLQFGTAGLRGALGGGPNRMNRAVVIRTAAGLADYLRGELDGLTPPPRVVVGYDARHLSSAFARD